MPQFLFAVFIMVLIYVAAKFFVRANPSSLAKTLRQLIGALLFAVGIALVFSLRFALFALPVLLAGAAVFFGSKRPFKSRGGSARSNGAGPHGAKGKASNVKTAFFDMELDHASGEMDGLICAGAFDGARLSDLEQSDLKALYNEISGHTSIDGDSLSLLETYLDSVLPGWREDFHVDSGTGQGSTASAGTITEEEAYEILGLGRDADVADIRAAHRRLMLKFHPDRGGSTVLAAKINEAKDILLRNHSSNS
ncbi:MAG: DnaJ domain-containing protein [Hyphomicrobiales bacterium]